MRREISKKKTLSLVAVGLLLLSVFVVLPSFAPAPSPTPLELWQLLSNIQEEIINIDSFLDGIYDTLNSVKDYLEFALPAYGDAILEGVGDTRTYAYNIDANLKEYGDLILDELDVVKAAISALGSALDVKLDLLRDELLEDHMDMLDTTQIMLDDVESTMRGDHDLMLDDLQAILNEFDAITDLKDSLESWFGPDGEYRKTAQFTSHGGRSIFEPEVPYADTNFYQLIYEDNTMPREVAMVTVTFKTAGTLHAEGLFVRYFVDPANPDDVIEKRVCEDEGTNGWTETAAAWKVEIRYLSQDGADTVWWACSAIHPPE